MTMVTLRKKDTHLQFSGSVHHHHGGTRWHESDMLEKKLGVLHLAVNRTIVHT